MINMNSHVRSGSALTRHVTKIVVVGFGFGGFSFCKEMWRISRRKGMGYVDLLVISDRRYITFTPTLPELAASRLSAASVSADIENLSEKFGFRLLISTVDRIDLSGRKVYAKGREVGYDVIVLSTGSSDNFHGISISGDNVISLRTVEDASVLAERLQAYKVGWDRPDKSHYQVAVIGGGRTGVEAASFLAERLVEIDLSASIDHPRIILLETSGRILPREPDEISEMTRRTLEKMGVEYRTSVGIKKIEGSKILLNSGEILHAGTTIWAAGIRPNTSMPGIQGTVQTKGGRIGVNARLEISGIKSAYAIGDIASKEEENGNTLAENASVAVQEGKFLARHIANSILEGKQREMAVFRYRSFGHVIPLGKHSIFIGPKGSALTGPLGTGITWFIHFVELFTNQNRVRFIIESVERWVRIVRTGKDLSPRRVSECHSCQESGRMRHQQRF